MQNLNDVSLMDDLKEILAKECNYRFRMDTPVMEKFIASLEEVHLKRGEVLTHYGQLDTNVYVVKSGIIKLSYFEGDTERVFAFGMPGSLSAQMHCYYRRLPSFFQSDACTDAVVMRIPKQRFDAFIEESEEFARWVLDRALDQLCGLEMRLERVNGQAYERYVSIVQLMPQVVGSVPAKVMASYLGVTPAYLSQLKKKYAIEVKKNKRDIDPFSSFSVK